MTDVIIGWDTEYQEIDPEGLGRPNPLMFKGPPKRRGHKSADRLAKEKFNEVLAYTVCVLDPMTGKSTTGIEMATSGDGPGIYSDWRRRLTMMGLITASLAGAVAAGTLPADRDGYQVIFAAHYTAADLPALRDFEELSQHKKRFFRAIRKTYVTLERPLKRTVRIFGVGHRVPVSVRLVDTMLWAPATHKSIAALGDSLDLPKIILPKGAVTNMRGLLADDPDLFREYAIRDAEVAALYAHKFLESCRNTFGIGDRIPVTASSAGVRFFTDTLDRSGYKIEDLIGIDKKTGEPLGGAIDVSHIAAECFHGGRNEAFWVGPTPDDLPLYDVDLAGCYPSCMAHIGMPGYERRSYTTDLARLAVINEALTFARVTFRFPKHVRFPCLPVRGDENTGLFYPITGTSWCTGPELAAARDLSAEIVVEQGIHVPWTDDFRPFLTCLGALQAIRSREKAAGRKGSVDERLAKEMANSVYGQTARAVGGMRQHGHRVKGFDLYDGSRPDLPPGKLSSPAIASYITGFARATVSELINKLPDDAVVISVTTDGFLSSIPCNEVDQTGPLMRAFTAGRQAIDPSEPALETKHKAGRAFSIRTRGVLSIDGDRTRDPLFARAGNRMDDDDLAAMVDSGISGSARQWAENDYWLETTATREYGLKVKRGRLRSIADQWALRGGDLTRKTIEVSVALEYDHKRRILDPATEWRGCFGSPTAPWETAEQAFDTRQEFAAWRNNQERVLRTADDLSDFRRYAKGVKVRKMGPTLSVDLQAIRWAAANGGNGLPDMRKERSVKADGRVSAPMIAEALTTIGFPTTRYQIHRLHGTDWNGIEPRPDDLERLKAEMAKRAAQTYPSGLVDTLVRPAGVYRGR